MRVTLNCAQCGGAFEATRRDARYCSAVCRKAAWRGASPAEQPAVMPGPVTRETRAVLNRMGADTSGDVERSALACAAAMDSPRTPPGALVGLSKVLPETLAYLREVYSESDE